MADDLIVEFCVEGVALSAQAKVRAHLRAWQGKVASRARAAAGDAGIIEDAVDVHISEFSETRTRDRDNVAKPILDAMQGIVFIDDRQVLRLESDWCDINGQYRVRYISMAVATALSVGRRFVWIRIYRHRRLETLTS